MCNTTNCGEHPELPEIQVSSKQRRRFLAGLASLPLSTVLAIPQLSRAAANRTETVSTNRSGGHPVSAALALPDADRAPTILLIHEWWGLNDQIKSMAVEFANLGYVALAVDLYAKPPVTDPESARAMMQEVNPEVATDTLVNWIDWLKTHPRSNGKVATIGWCFGGGWSLNASLATPVDATVIYYGNVKVDADKLRLLAGPVLGHFATRDDWINEQMVGGFANAMKQVGKDDSLSVNWYDADHAFANPTSSRYDEPNAALAWERTLGFLRDALL